MRLTGLFGFIVLVLGITVPIAVNGPGLVADTVNGPNWTRATDLSVSKAKCREWLKLVSTCSVRYTGPVRTEIMPVLSFFISGSWAREQVVLLRSTRNPALVSTVQGVRDLAARQVTMALWISIWPALQAWTVLAALARRRQGAGRTAAPERDAEVSPAPLYAAAAMSTPGFQPPGAAPTFGRRGR